MNFRRSLPLLLCFMVSHVYAEEKAKTSTEPPPKTYQEALARAGVKVTVGPKTVGLGSEAEFKLPSGYLFVGPDSLDRFFELNHNIRDGSEVGIVLSPDNWLLAFEFHDIGYVKDDDKDSLDADKLLATLKKSQEEGNEERTKRGWGAFRLNGWSSPPHYDPMTHYLKWAINISSSENHYASAWVNESIRLLGRGGVMNVTLACSPAQFTRVETTADSVLASDFSYRPGSRYSEFKSGDKLAGYGLAALIGGGAVAIAAKTGLLTKFLALLAAGWKFVMVAVLAVGSAIGRTWKKFKARITGDSNDPRNSQTG